MITSMAGRGRKAYVLMPLLFEGASLGEGRSRNARNVPGHSGTGSCMSLVT